MPEITLLDSVALSIAELVLIMGLVSCAQTLHAEQASDSITPGSSKNQGILKSQGKEYSVFVFADSESVTEAVSQFLQDINQEPLPNTLHDFESIHITQQLIENEEEIAELLEELFSLEPESTSSSASDRKQLHGTEQSAKREERTHLHHNASALQTPSKNNETVYTSLFSLARSFNSTLSQEKKSHQTSQGRPHGREENLPATSLSMLFNSERASIQENCYEREGQRENRDNQGREKREDQENEDSSDHQQHNQHHKRDRTKKKKVISIESIQAARPNESKDASDAPRNVSASAPQRNIRPSVSHGGGHAQPVGSVESIYVRFMALMARILGQAEYEAHQLYVRIKERTDNIDVLTLLVSKVNSEKGSIDWTKNEEMKQLIERARTIGVDIPADKLKWSEEEKKLLKENVQMRKDSMEKMTQLERTDMQRFLQEASQCHQARSNVLKLLKEVMDTIIANMRGG